MQITKKTLSDIAIAYGVEVEFDSQMFREDELNIGTTDGEQIWLSKFDDMEIMAIAFLHELGHILFQRRFFQRSRSFSKITDEGAAWEIAFMLADDLLRPLNAYHNKKLRKYALQCMRSYMTEYNELDDKHE